MLHWFDFSCHICFHNMQFKCSKEVNIWLMSFTLLLRWVGQCPSEPSGCGTTQYSKSKAFRYSGRITGHRRLVQLLFTSRQERELNGISFWSTLRDEIALSAESYRVIIIYRIIYNILDSCIDFNSNTGLISVLFCVK